MEKAGCIHNLISTVRLRIWIPEFFTDAIVAFGEDAVTEQYLDPPPDLLLERARYQVEEWTETYKGRSIIPFYPTQRDIDWIEEMRIYLRLPRASVTCALIAIDKEIPLIIADDHVLIALRRLRDELGATQARLNVMHLRNVGWCP